MAHDERPLPQVIGEFAGHFYDMLCEPDAVALQRVVMAESAIKIRNCRNCRKHSTKRARA